LKEKLIVVPSFATYLIFCLKLNKKWLNALENDEIVVDIILFYLDESWINVYVRAIDKADSSQLSIQ
jgi:hypothetical protein